MENMTIIDGNEAAALIAYRLSEVIAIYPITPSSTMGELADQWMSQKQKNIWNIVPTVIEMQSEGGAAGTVHGALSAGALSTTFTASQGLLLMIPNMYKIAGEMIPTVFHIAARTIATSGLSIFGDHQDVMAARQTGFAFLSSNSVQEAHDMALIAHASTLKSRIPFLHFFDGFRTSHEVQKIEQISDEVIRNLISIEDVIKHRGMALTPDNPHITGTAMNPDVCFQARERINPFYEELPSVVIEVMKKFKSLTGRSYLPFDYYGAKDATEIIIMMGSGAETVEETIEFLNKNENRKLGLIKVRLFRPFSMKLLLEVIPESVKTICVLDRTKEPGATGEPLYQDVVTAFMEGSNEGFWNLKLPKIIGGRFGLSSKEFTPAMVKGIFDEMLRQKPKNHFSVGIKDDVTNNSIDYDFSFDIEDSATFRGIFWGLGADGTVSANKNSIKIIGEETENYAQGFFVYDSKKSGSKTTSHLRFGKNKIRSTYLISTANFIAIHQFQFLEKYDVLKEALPGSTLLLNAPYPQDEVWNNIPGHVQQIILDKKLKVYSIDALSVARNEGMGGRINTIMQTCFFAISGILERNEAIEKIKHSIKKTFIKKGMDVVEKNYKAVDATLANLFEIKYLEKTNDREFHFHLPDNASDFVKNFTAKLIQDKGDEVPVSLLPANGVFPTGTTKFEKRNITDQIPIWDQSICIQCGKCSFVCPHSVIRIKAYDEKELENAPASFRSMKAKGAEFDPGTMYTIQVAPEDCTGCELCVEVCPAKSKSAVGRKAINMESIRNIQKDEIANWNYFDQIQSIDRLKIKKNNVKGSQLLEPLFEFSGACSGCGETPYIKLATQLFGDRMLIANATGCSSIYGGNLPTTPYTKNAEGRGPAWSNSLFEDNAEYGLGMRLAVEQKENMAKELLCSFTKELSREFVEKILNNPQSDESQIFDQRKLIVELKEKLQNIKSENSKSLLSLCDYLVKKSVWIFGGDGWAYDIGYGGLDHVLASGKNVNILVLDTEVYSNTGGQMSKATPMGAVAKFASNGRALGKKDLALQAIAYGHVYVAKIAFGANDTHTLKVLQEAEKFDGPSLIIAYSHCIAHGYNLKYGLQQQKLAIDTGHWHLFRYHPDEVGGLNLDSDAPKKNINEFMNSEARFKMLSLIDPKRAEELARNAQVESMKKFDLYKYMSVMNKVDDSNLDKKE